MTNSVSYPGGSSSYSAVDLGNIELTQTFAAVAVSSITDASFYVMHPLAPPTTSSNPTPAPVPLMVLLGYSNGTTTTLNLDTTNTGWNLEDVTADLTAGLDLDSISVFGYVPTLAQVLSGQASSAYTYVDDFDINVASTSSSTPEPGSLLLLGTGLIGAAGLIRRRFARSE